MPLYEYKCPKGHVTELRLHLGDGDMPPQRVACKGRGCLGLAERVYSKPMVPLLGDDAMFRRRRRPMATDVTTSDDGKARKRL